MTTAGRESDHWRRFVLVARVIGIAVALLAVAFCVRTLVHSWSEVRAVLSGANVGWLSVAVALSAAAMLVLALMWWQCLRLFGVPAGAGSAVAWYFGGELGKYAPGGIWTVLGRGELARRGGVDRSSTYATTLVSYGVMCAAAAVVCGALAPGAGASWLGWTLLPLVACGLAAVHPAILGRALQLTRRVSRGRLDLPAPAWRSSLRLLAWTVAAWALLGAAAVAVTAAFGVHQHPARVALAAVAAWIIGFLAVPVPAGVGIREVLFVALCGLATTEATTIAVIMRALLVFVDAAGGAVALGATTRAVRRAGAS